ncbi:hypothetical protein QRX60_41705 [Amycolatopsis mongoliensis]|uniref:Uncharacterized protein n=1 Tax=Amycolatopsis mongoliensis TaxID=715475 RepID=A0A9Y2NJW5_9PSEU|nr:hypothetical protein [Amycolatopsis sp. 4-36]WIY00510.1 hypothetical protein QRX60_41705 [Amycolatopsis sp. 4-36]
MTEMWRTAPEDVRTIEVRVYQDGRLLLRQLCESDEEANSVVDHWSEVEGVTCEVDDLAFRHRQTDILEPTPADFPDEDAGPAVPR